MSVIDYVFLAACVLGLALVLICSQVIRAILWESLRHPFRPSRIEIDQGRVVVNRLQSPPATGTQPPTPAGAR